MGFVLFLFYDSNHKNIKHDRPVRTENKKKKKQQKKLNIYTRNGRSTRMILRNRSRTVVPGERTLIVAV